MQKTLKINHELEFPNAIFESIASVRSKFSDMVKSSLMGREVIIENKHSKDMVVMMNLHVFKELLDTLTFTLDYIKDDDLHVVTCIVKELGNYYAEGKTNDEALDNIVTFVIEECENYLNHYEQYSMYWNERQEIYLKKIIHGGLTHEKVKESLNGGCF